MGRRNEGEEGDTLLILSEWVYGTPDYAKLLAEYNNLNKFRHPKPGTEVVFPPIIPGD